MREPRIVATSVQRRRDDVPLLVEYLMDEGDGN